MSRSFLSSVLVFAWITLPAADVVAQDRAVIGEGERIRISATESGEQLFVGEVVALSSETLTVNYWEPIDRNWEVLDFPVSSINSLEVNRGTRSHAGKGALLGGLIGGGFGLAAGIAAASYDCSADPWDWDGCWYWGEAGIIPVSTITFGLLGAGVGALIGMLSRSDQWEPIPPDRLRVRVSPTSDGIALAFSVGI
jgi:hypothetical protein